MTNLLQAPALIVHFKEMVLRTSSFKNHPSLSSNSVFVTSNGKETIELPGLLCYLRVDLVKQGKQEGVEVPQEEGEDAAQLPLEGDAGMVVLQLCDGLKQRRTHQAQQGHDDLQLVVTMNSLVEAEPLGLAEEPTFSMTIFTSFFSYQLRSSLVANSWDLFTTK